MTKIVVQATAGQFFNNASTSSALTTLSSTTGAGNSIYVLINGTHTSGFDISSVTDTAGNTYAEVVQSGLDEIASRSRALIWAAHNIAAQASNVVTITYSNASANYAHATAVEVSADGVQSTDQTGSDTEPYNDQSITATCGGANTDDAAIVFGVGATHTGANHPTISLPTNHTNLYEYTPGAGTYRPAARHSYRILTAGETTSATWAIDETTNAPIAAIATFKEAASNKFLKLLAHSSAAGATVAGTVFNAPSGGDITGAKIGEFTSVSFLGANSLDGGKAKLLVSVTSFGGGALTTANTPHIYVRTSSFDTGIVPATVIEV